MVIYILANLPSFLACPKTDDTEDAKNAFKRICPENVIIVAVNGVNYNRAPACVWRVYYEMKNYEYHVEDGSKSNQIWADLSKDEASLLEFFEKLTNKAGMLDLGIAGKYKALNTAVVEYFPRACECNVQNFNRTIEEPCMWSIKEAEINLQKLKMHL